MKYSNAPYNEINVHNVKHNSIKIGLEFNIHIMDGITGKL